MEDYSYINVISNSENLRLYVIEHTLHVEEMISISLGVILNLDWKKSKSFGHGSTALSFNQKVQIIQDLKGLDKTDVQRLTDLMIIRNKFAHVKSIETFKDFFESGKAPKEVKKNLDKWYGSEFSKFQTDNEEFKYKFYFFHLFWSIAQMLITKISEHAYERGRNEGTNEYHAAIKEEVIKMKGGEEILAKALKKVKENLNEDNQLQ
jgi:hypothetical protein